MLALLLLLAQSSEDEARAAVEKAEEAARAGRYADAQVAYERAAKKYPGTPSGTVAARRSHASAFLGWDWVVQHGPSSNRVDVVLMGSSRVPRCSCRTTRDRAKRCRILPQMRAQTAPRSRSPTAPSGCLSPAPCWQRPNFPRQCP